jgi:glycosyltransferase involved in cell wall biosynthesis
VRRVAGAIASPNAPLISIIVLCHNYGRFLPEALDSALAQTYSNREILVFDDGSTDDSLEVARGYADAVRVFSHPNMGIERTCNRGMAEARGEYCTFLSADDVLEPTYVADLFDALTASPEASFAYCRMRMFGAQTGLMRCFPFSAYLLALRTNFVNGSALTNRADYLAVGGISEDLGEFALEDWDLWLKMVEHGKRGTYVGEPLLRWRRHDAGSRNPEAEERRDRALAGIRERHRDLLTSLSGPRARLAYALDFAVAAADIAFGLSRWPRLVRKLEQASWRRFERYHLSRLPTGNR